MFSDTAYTLRLIEKTLSRKCSGSLTKLRKSLSPNVPTQIIMSSCVWEDRYLIRTKLLCEIGLVITLGIAGPPWIIQIIIYRRPRLQTMLTFSFSFSSKSLFLYLSGSGSKRG